MVQKIKRDTLEGAVIPCEIGPDGKQTGYKFRLMSSGGSRAIDINASITRDRIDELVSLLWEFSLLGTTDVGSRSLGDSKTQLAAVALGGAMDILTETINLQGVTEWGRINKAPAHLWPELTHGDIEKENITEWINGLVQAASGGFILPTDEDEKKVREKFGLEQRAPDDTILAQPDDEGDPFGLGLEGEGGEEKAKPGMLDRLKGLLGGSTPEPEPEPEPEEQTAMTAEDAAKWLNVSRSVIMTAIRNGKLPGAKIGGTYRILKADLIEFMKPSAQT
jgi:excisionase family DNA binding protein